MLNIGFPKGNIKAKSLGIISRLFGKDIDPEKLTFCDGQDCRAFLLKQRDIPSLLLQGRLDCAVVSTEWLEERKTKFSILCDLGWSRYHICLIGSPSKPFDDYTGPATCVTEYPTMAKKYLRKKGWDKTELVVVSGSSEGFVPSIFDCCIDCVETGATIKRHGLMVLDVLFETNVVMVARDKTIQLNDRLLAAIKEA